MMDKEECLILQDCIDIEDAAVVLEIDIVQEKYEFYLIPDEIEH